MAGSGYREAVIASAPTHYYLMEDLTALIGTAMTLGGGTITYAAGAYPTLGNGMVFNGGSFGVIPRTVTDDFSFEFWIKTTQSGATGGGNFYNMTGILGDEVAGVVNDLAVCLSSTQLVMGMGNGDSSAFGPAVNDGSWHHIVITRQTSVIEFYKDGTLANTVTGQPAATRNAGANIGVGAISSGGNQYFVGSLDELAIYTRRLSAAEVLNHYTLRALESSFYQVVG